MDGEDVVMGDAPGSSTPSPTLRFRLPATQNGQGQNGAGVIPAQARVQAQAQAPSLMQTFQEKVPAPGKLVAEVEAHQKTLGSVRKGESSSSSVEKDEAGEEDFEGSDLESESELGGVADDSVEQTRLLPRASLPTGLCYDVRMRYHCEVRPTADVHPEDPRRIYYIYKELCKAGLVEDKMSSRPLVDQPLYRIPARDATEDEISLVHERAHYAFVKSTQGGFIC